MVKLVSKQEKSISQLQIPKHFIFAFIFGFLLVALFSYLLDADTIRYVAYLSLFSLISTLLLTIHILKNPPKIVEEPTTELSLKEIEQNILDALQAFKVEAILQEGEEIVSYNQSAKEKAFKSKLDFESASLASLSSDDTKKLAIFPPPATINPNEGEEFVLRLSVPCAIIDDKTKLLESNADFLELFTELKKNSLFTDLLDESESKKLMNLLEVANKKNLAPATKFQVVNTQKFFILSIDKITKSKTTKFIVQAVDISDFIYDESRQIQNQKMQAVGQLAGSVAHDFNNLLTAMIGFCDILLGQYGPTDPGFHETMQIKQNANRAAELVKQLLAFSRKQVLNLSATDVNEVIVELASLLKRLLGEQIDIKIDCARKIKFAMTDKNQLEQVLINLCVNARDAMDGKGKLNVKTREETIGEKFDESKLYAPSKFDRMTPGEYVVIEIADTGSGIPKDIIESIFEPFFSTKDPGSGTGLGLSTVLGIVKQIGGHVRLQTELGKGTTFYIYLEQALEIKKVQAYRDNIEMSLISNLCKKDQQEKASKVLIVEDEEPVRMFESHALRSKGFEIVEMDNAYDAIEYLKEDGSNIDLVITDVIMPGLTGPEMVEQVKDLYPNIKFLFTSGYTEEALGYFDENTHHHFLSKPFSLDTLINMVDKILKHTNE